MILIAKELSVPVMQVAATAKLLGDGATVPFIARYRKEATGSLDEVAIAAIRDGLERLKALDDRREAIKKSLAERNLLTDELSAAIAAAETASRSSKTYTSHSSQSAERVLPSRGKGGWNRSQTSFSTTSLRSARQRPPNSSPPKRRFRTPRRRSPARATSSQKQ